MESRPTKSSWLVLRKNPNAAGMNYAVSAATGVVVVRNHMVK